MKKIHLFCFSFLFIAYTAKAQYTNEDYKITYKLKLQGVYCQGDLKNAHADLIALFDSNYQSFTNSDSIITIRSAFDESENTFRDKLSNYGYTVLSFSKIKDPIGTEIK